MEPKKFIFKKQFIKNLEQMTGMSAKEIQDASPEELDKKFLKRPFEGLNPSIYRDAKKILKKYKSMKKEYADFCEIIPREVMESRFTIAFRKKY